MIRDFAVAASRARRLTTYLVSGTRRSDLLTAALCAVIVATATSGAAWSLDARRDALERRLADLAPSEAIVVVRSADLVELPASVDPLVAALATVETAAADFPPALVEVLEEPVTVVDTARFALSTIDGEQVATPTKVIVRVQPGLDRNAVLVEGRAARPDSTIDDVVEVVMSVDTASELSVEVGDDLAVALDFDDPLARRSASLPEPFRIVVTGIVELAPVDDPFWFGDARLHRPIVDDTPVGAERIAYVAAPPGALVDAPFVATGSSPLAAEYRTRIDVDRVTLADIDDLSRAVATVDATTSRTAAIGQSAVVVGIGGQLGASNEERSAARDSGRVAFVGWALVALGSVAQLDLRRQRARRREFDLALRRGVPRGVLLAATATAGAVPVALAATVGAVGASVMTSLAGLGVAARVGVGSVLVTVGFVAVVSVAHASVALRVERTELPGGLRVERLDATPPAWRRLGPIVRLVLITAWCAALAVLVRSGVRSADAAALAVLYGSSAAAVFATHRPRSVRDARWAAFAASGAVSVAAVAAVAGAAVPSGAGRAGQDLADRVGWEVTGWAISAIACAVVAVAVSATGTARRVMSLVASLALSLILLVFVGRVVAERVDLDADGRPFDGALSGAVVTAAATAAIVVFVAVVSERCRRIVRRDPSNAGAVPRRQEVHDE